MMRLLISMLIVCLSIASGEAAGLPDLLPGDILATRNADEADNTSPGHWNHLAVYVGDGLMVESQVRRGVICTAVDDFLGRYPEWIVLRLRIGSGQAIADEARRHVGTPYWHLASVPIRLRRTERGNNCVSVVRRAAAAPRAIGRDPGWLKPDDAVGDAALQPMSDDRNGNGEAIGRSTGVRVAR